MSWSEYATLLALSTAVAFTPGPNTTLSTAIAANHGLARAMRFVWAVPVGWGLLLTVCALGVGGLVVAQPLLAGAIKVAGVGYLLFLAFRLCSAGQWVQADSARWTVGFWQGVALQFVNIKAWMFALTVCAAWLAGKSDWPERFLIVLLTMMAYALASNFTYAAIGSVLRVWLAQHERLLWFNRAMAAVLVLTAAWMWTV